MAIDMEQFKKTFVEESIEGLETMETVLLGMEPGSTDGDAIDTIFRAAHSIKGGSATFGYDDISSFTHSVETLLDQVRGGRRELTQDAIAVFLESVDCIRDMLHASQSGVAADTGNIDRVSGRLQHLLGDRPASSASTTPGATLAGQSIAQAVEPAVGQPTGHNGEWRIHFKPFPDMLRSGNDVVRMLRELAELGSITVKVNAEALPPLADLQPEESYLAWDITLTGAITRDKINEIFEWVADECELSITEPAAPARDTTVAGAESASTTGRSGAVPSMTLVQSAAGDGRAAGKETAKKSAAAGAGEGSSIRVGTDKVDALINMVGELVITQSMLSQLGEDFQMDRLHKLKDGLAELERNTRELQETVMRIRMLPINFAFNRFPRMVYDLSSKLGKKVELKMSGEQTELDKTVMEKIGDPLVHLVRNSIDHGIEPPAVRKAHGKPETGTVHLNAFHKGGNIVIEIHDDGAGLNKDKILAKARERGLVSANDKLSDEQIHDLIFRPGFSTAEQVTDVSGRGVGMDVVRRNITALGGSVEIKSELGKGSTFTVRLPLTLSILDGQLVRVGDQIFIIPLVSIVESLQINRKQVNAIAGKAEIYQLRSDYLPIIRLYKAFGVTPDNERLDNGLLVVVEGDGMKAGLLVDDLLAQQQVVIKSLETNFKRVNGISGATILGDGTVALIVDTAGVIRLYQDNGPDSVADNDGRNVAAA
jgi:two-component system chemotaxis sensor kinase CheA